MHDFHRRSIRLKGYDYTQAGAYYVTICVHHRECWFGDVVKDEMILSHIGNLAADCWNAIPEHFQNVELDEWIVMPNHVHGIIVITSDDRNATSVGATHVRATHASPLRPHGPQKRSLGAIVGSFKSAATKCVNEYRHMPKGKLWQRNYHEHIIRDDESLKNIRHYIRYNPQNWNADEENPQHDKS
jgi:REP element-mobilizing transposase RayT